MLLGLMGFRRLLRTAVHVSLSVVTRRSETELYILKKESEQRRPSGVASTFGGRPTKASFEHIVKCSRVAVVTAFSKIHSHINWYAA